MVVVCRRCGEPLSRALERLAVIPELAPHPDWQRNGGCCGHDGMDGPNRPRFEPAAVHLVPAEE